MDSRRWDRWGTTQGATSADSLTTAGQHSSAAILPADDKHCDDRRRSSTLQLRSPAVLPFWFASGSAVGNATNKYGVVTPGRQSALGCEGLRLPEGSTDRCVLCCIVCKQVAIIGWLTTAIGTV